MQKEERAKIKKQKAKSKKLERMADKLLAQDEKNQALKKYDLDETAIDLALEFGIKLTQHNNDIRIYQKIRGVGGHTD